MTSIASDDKDDHGAVYRHGLISSTEPLAPVHGDYATRDAAEQDAWDRRWSAWRSNLTEVA
ncbi:hypothetical protein [Nocardia transvalensis]|uniref:hypothetical protein n=1 Tax=Nocardia transvalensis TaxID=37333 RepID=UPI00189425D5|nr:hypothetical protein [Nocardia transvalensis]MBF6333509.1 hypothetical protein [Nocardia transvalensis]